MDGDCDDKNIDRAKVIANARAALAERRASDPQGVSRFKAKTALLDVARKRERVRFERLVLGQGDPRPTRPVLRRPPGMAKQVWKAEQDRAERAYKADLASWDERERRRGRNAPPGEQMDKAPFVERDVHDGFTASGKPIKIGKAFTRQPRFETFDWLSVPQVTALRRYRRAFDVSEMSPVKSGLDIGAGGSSGGSEAAIVRLEALAFADIAVQRMEAGIPAGLLRTLRAVALEDADFKAVAIERFGSASGQRRTRVRRDFERSVNALVSTMAPPAPPPQPAATVNVRPPAPSVNSAFLDEQGHLRSMEEIAAIILAGGTDVDEAA